VGREWEKLFRPAMPLATDRAGNLRGALGALAEGGDAVALIDARGALRALLSCGQAAGGWAAVVTPSAGGSPDGDFAMNTNFQNGSELGITLSAGGALAVQIRGAHATPVLHLAPDLTPVDKPGEPSLTLVRDSVCASLLPGGWLKLMPVAGGGAILWRAGEKVQ
jgi:hypothetical protein